MISFFKCKTRHYITTEKKSGVISGKQRTEGGDIEWSTELPRTCSLSAYVWPILVTKVSIEELHAHVYNCYLGIPLKFLHVTYGKYNLDSSAFTHVSKGSTLTRLTWQYRLCTPQHFGQYPSNVTTK